MSSYERCVRKLLWLRNSWYSGTASWKVGVSQGNLDRCLLIEVGSCFRNDSGWLKLLCT